MSTPTSSSLTDLEQYLNDAATSIESARQAARKAQFAKARRYLFRENAHWIGRAIDETHHLDGSSEVAS